jgi:hypothetical protein
MGTEYRELGPLGRDLAIWVLRGGRSDRRWGSHRGCPTLSWSPSR